MSDGSTMKPITELKKTVAELLATQKLAVL